MYKDFDKWNEKKKILENLNPRVICKERDVWWCSVGINIAYESCGKGKDFRRPVLVLKKLTKYAFIGIPLSTKRKVGSWYFPSTIEGVQNYVLLHQVRMFSVNRLQRRLSVLELDDFVKLKKQLEGLLELL